MRPAALTDVVGGIDVEVVARTQPLDQLVAEVDLAGLLILFGFDLTQPIDSPTDHKLPQPHTLAAPAQRVQCLTNGRCFSY
jgi:hypothetical protein